MLSRWMLVLSLFVSVLFSASAAYAEKRVALVIGNSSYAHAGALRNPRNDANDLADTLQKLGFEVLLGLDLDQQKFAATVEQYARMLEDAEVGLLFYAGHGLQINDKNYLVSVNAKLESEFLISSETIELDAIVKLMESKATTNLVFLDACRNNPLTDNLRRNLAAMKRSASVGRGLARVESSGRDTLIAFAAAPGQEAADGNDRNSPFTSALLKHLPKPGIEVSVMLKEVAADVRRDTRNSQRPQQLSDMTRTFYFAKAEPPASVAVAAAVAAGAPRAEPRSSADDRALEVAFWNAAQSANECDAVRAYMARFPNGIFIELARLSERRLCGQGRRVTVAEPSADTPPAAGGTPPAMPQAAPAPAEPRPVIAALPQPGIPEAEAQKSTSAMSGPELVRNIQLELIRTGCASGGADGTWGKSGQAAIRLFNKHAKTSLNAAEPSQAMLAALQEQDERVCPLQCERGFRASGNNCVAIQREPVRERRKAAEPERPRKQRAERPSYRSVEDDRPRARRQAPQAAGSPQAPASSVSRPTDSPYECFTDEGQGRRRPCGAGR